MDVGIAVDITVGNLLLLLMMILGHYSFSIFFGVFICIVVELNVMREYVD